MPTPDNCIARDYNHVQAQIAQLFARTSTPSGGATQVVDVNNADAVATSTTSAVAYDFHGFHSGPGTASRALTLPASPQQGQIVIVFVSDDSIDVDGQNRKVTIDGNGNPIVSQQNTPLAAVLDGTGYYPTADAEKFTLGGPWVGSHGAVELLFDTDSWYVLSLYAPYALLPSAAVPLEGVDADFQVPEGSPNASFGFSNLGGARTITLPASPFCSQTFTFTDLDGSINDGGQTVTLDGNGFNIRSTSGSAATFVMSPATTGSGGSVTLQFQADNVWHVIATT